MECDWGVLNIAERKAYVELYVMTYDPNPPILSGLSSA